MQRVSATHTTTLIVKYYVFFFFFHTYKSTFVYCEILLPIPRNIYPLFDLKQWAGFYVRLRDVYKFDAGVHSLTSQYYY